MVALKKKPHPQSQPELVEAPALLRCEDCQDEDGNRFTVLVWQVYPQLSIARYTLDDGAPVAFIDDCRFETASGSVLSRC